MKAVIKSGKNSLEINWSWLPTWMGMNTALMNELDSLIRPHIVGKPMNQDTLDTAHDLVLDFLVEKYKIPGLYDYLDGLKYVTEITDECRKTEPSNRSSPTQ